MYKRFLEYTPKELTKLTKKAFLDGIRSSEGRVVGAYVCPYAPNYLEKVSNIELVASFGADLITLEGLNPRRLQIPGLTSKNSEDEAQFKKNLQIEMGFGWTVPELKELIGRPIGLILLVPATPDDNFGPVYGDAIYSKEMIRFVLDQGYDHVVLCAWDPDVLITAVEESASIINDKMVIEAGIPHGPGAIVDETFPPYNLRHYLTPKLAGKLATAGADIVDIPAVGVVPGFSIEYVTELVDAVHEGKSLAAASIAHSVEGSDENTVRRVAVDNKVCGADLYNFAAGGVFESVALPEALQNFCIAVKGKRHTYRRICQSILR